MVSQNFDDPAVGDLPVAALADHAPQLSLQAQETLDLAFDLTQLA